MKNYKDIVFPETVEILKQSKGTHTDIKCPDCDGHLIVREGYSKFLGCSNYPKCKTKIGFPVAVDFSAPYLLNKEVNKFNSSIIQWETDNRFDPENDPPINCKEDM